jgi:molecular chaperone GrpE
MTEREFLNALDRHGVRRINPKGEAFNPHQHQAMMEMQNTDVAPGTILEVYQCGYLIDERVLRPAMVVVAKGGPKPGQPAEPSATEEPAASPDAAPPPGNDNVA